MSKVEEVKAITTAYGYEFDGSKLDELVSHVDTHEYFLGKDILFKFSWNDALFSWFENIFVFIDGEAKRGALQRWTGMSQEELFFEISHEWYMLNLAYGKYDVYEAFPAEAVKAVARLRSRHNGVITRLFSWVVA